MGCQLTFFDIVRMSLPFMKMEDVEFYKDTIENRKRFSNIIENKMKHSIIKHLNEFQQYLVTKEYDNVYWR